MAKRQGAFFVFMLILVLVASVLVACGKKDTPDYLDIPSDSIPSTPAHAVHAYGEWQVIRPATCTATGLKKRTCECGKEETEEINATGHTEAIDQAIEPTCTEIGLTEGKHCSVCGTTLLPQEEIKALGHDLIHHETKEPTCTEKGWGEYDTCSRCTFSTYEEINAKGHTEITEQAVEPTCTETGLTEGKHCSVCGATLVSQEEVKALDHRYVEGFCLRCGKKEPQETVGLVFELQEDDTYAVAGYSGESTEIIILDTHNGKKVTKIKESAFKNCSFVVNIEMPSSISQIGEGAFSGCSSLESMTLPFIGSRAGVTSADFYQYPFGYIFGTERFTAGERTSQIYYGDSVSNTTTTYYYIPNKLSTVIITGGDILPYAFYQCKNLKTVIIGNGTNAIGTGAFSFCTALKNITIGKNITEINSAFNCRHLTNVYYKGSLESWCKITFGDDEFSNPLCYAHNFYIRDELVQDIIIPNTISEIKDNAFYGWNGINITIPDSIIKIGKRAFYNCTNITNITIPQSVTEIGAGAFGGCFRLVEVYNKSSLPVWKNEYCGRYALAVYTEEYNSKIAIDSNGLIVYTDNLEKIAIGYRGNKTELVIPDDITQINHYAFRDDDSLTRVTIGKEVRKIGADAFGGCTVLTSVFYAGDIASWCGITFTEARSNPLYHAHNLYLNNQLATEIVIPNTVSEIKKYAFIGWNGMKIEIPNTIISVGERAFSNCSNLQFNEYNNAYYLGNSNNQYVFLFKIKNEEIMSCSIHQNTRFINENAFIRSKITSIIIPDGVKRIGESTFYDCRNLSSIKIPGSVEIIGSGAFSSCSALTSVYYTGDIASWCRITFGNVDSLWGDESSNPLYYAHNLYIDNKLVKDITIPETITEIKSYAFCGWNGTSVTIPNSVEVIRYSAFSGCTGLIDISIPDSVTTIYAFAFYNCSALENITLPFVGYKAREGSDKTYRYPLGYIFGNHKDSSYPYYGHRLSKTEQSYHASSTNDDKNELFYIPLTLKSVTILGGSIPYGAFYNCTNLISVTLGNSVSEIDEGAFYNCINLKSITILSDEIDIASNVFNSCPIETAMIPALAISYIPKKQLKTVVITSGKIIEESAFFGCTGLTSITISDSVTSIGNNAFYNCGSLTSITFQGTKSQWNAISKGSSWDYNTGNFTVHCMDGNISK